MHTGAEHRHEPTVPCEVVTCSLEVSLSLRISIRKLTLFGALFRVRFDTVQYKALRACLDADADRIF